MTASSSFWSGLMRVQTAAALMADWQWALGSGLRHWQPFLRPTSRIAESIACGQCDCRHVVREWADALVAVCVCEPNECRPIPVQPSDLLVYEVDTAALGEAICGVLGFAPPRARISAPLPGLQAIGTYSRLHAPVCLAWGEPETVTRSLRQFRAVHSGPAVLLALEDAPEPLGPQMLWLQLPALLDLNESGQFAALSDLQPVLGAWAARLVEQTPAADALAAIHREIASVRDTVVELRTARERLERMQAEGWLAFTRKVDPRSFKIFCAVLAEGDLSKASRALGMRDSTLRAAVEDWAGRGDAYRTMLDLMRWRKKVRRHGTVTLNENVVLEKASSCDYPALLSDVLDGLLSMTEENWQERCEELAELLRPAVR